MSRNRPAPPSRPAGSRLTGGARLATILGGGMTAAFLLALGFGDSGTAAAEVVGLAAGAASALSVAGWAAMRGLRRRPLAVHLWVGVTTVVLGVAVGVVIAGWRMFLSPGDARTVLVILLAAGTVEVVTAVAMGTRLDRGVQDLTAVAGSLGRRPTPAPVVPAVPTRELAALGSRLQEVAGQLHEAAARERALEDARRQLVAWMSHDLRTPLAGIRAVTEALEDGVVTDRATVTRYHRTMRTEVERLSTMVDDLFRLSRIHAGLPDPGAEMAPLGDLVSDALALAAPTAEARHIRLGGRMGGEHGTAAHVTTEMARVLGNLLDNALRHTPRGGAVTVRAEARAGAAVVAVDDGCGGIPDQELARVFDVGFCGDTARTPGPGKRAGLGLAIVRGLVEAHGGDVSVANDGPGCRFTVRLPLPPPPARPSAG